MKFVNTGVVFQEVPDEVTLSVNISNCPCHCMGCHSEYLWDDIGEPLNAMSMGMMLKDYAKDITCVCLMGGDAETKEVNDLAAWIRSAYPKLKIGWYSGRRELSPDIKLRNFDYVKLGPYVETKGPLNKPTTNQRMYQVVKEKMEGKPTTYKLNDITSKFWKDAMRHNI